MNFFNVLSLIFSSAGFFVNDIRLLFLFVFLSLIPLFRVEVHAIEKTHKRIYLFVNSAVTLAAFLVLHRDMIDLAAEEIIFSPSGVFLVYLMSFLRFGLFPFHSFIQILARKRKILEIISAFFPLPLYLIYLSKNYQSVSFFIVPLCYYGLATSCYFCLAGFKEEKILSYFIYLLSSLLTYCVAVLPFIEADFMIVMKYYLLNIYLCMAAFATCFVILYRRYGVFSFKYTSGMSELHPEIGYIFLFFVFVLACMPLTFSFMGEEIIFHELFHFYPAFVFFSLFMFFIWGISLYRCYINFFCGRLNVSFVKLKLMIVEKVVLILLIAIGAVTPFLIS